MSRYGVTEIVADVLPGHPAGVLAGPTSLLSHGRCVAAAAIAMNYSGRITGSGSPVRHIRGVVSSPGESSSVNTNGHIF